MKTFNESLVPIDLLEKPEAWALSMVHVTGADIDDLRDYAKRCLLLHELETAQGARREHAVNEALRYLLGMGR